MSSGAKIAVVIAVVVAAGALLFSALAAAGLLFYWRSARQEQAAQIRDQVSQMDADAARARERVPAPPAPIEDSAPATAPAPADSAARPVAERRREAMARGIECLAKLQAPDGSWAEGNFGVTALCADALLECGRTAADPTVRRAIDFLLKAQKEDGGIYGDAELKNYTTSIAVMVLVKADPKAYAAVIEKATAYLIENQWDEQESVDKDNPWYGGAGYGKSGRPDLSNTQYFVQAMQEAGIPKDHPLWAKVVVFVSRNQDRSESNDGAFVGTESGGMIYSPHKGGESKAGAVDLPDGRKGLKAYGSMTYAGFKSFIYANLQRDDPRVRAAMDWIRKHWTFEENPEVGQQGLFYYYETAAKALKAWGEDTIVDGRDRRHDWRDELSEAILKRQRPDGSWINEADRWFEGFPPVPTSYALIALANCQ